MKEFNPDAIRSLRLSRNLTQDAFAEILNKYHKTNTFTKQHISNWETGDNKPSINSLFLIINAFNCSFDLFIKGRP